MIVLEVLGTPAPKGSSRAMLIGGKARNVPSGSNVNRDRLKSWDASLRAAARAAVGDVTAPPYVAMPLVMVIEFRVARPGSHWGTGKRTGQIKPRAPLYPITKPDSSKLVRATEDALTGIVWDDDSRVGLHLVNRVYAAPGREGARIAIGLRKEFAITVNELATVRETAIGVANAEALHA